MKILHILPSLNPELGGVCKAVRDIIYGLEKGNSNFTNEVLCLDNPDEKYIKNEVKRLGLQNVRFTGLLSGKEKDEAIASLSVLAMPSEFENFGNVILEGLIRKIPCIATKGAPWQELETYHCGWWVDYSQEGITSAIEKALNTSREKLAIMGENGRALLEQNYTVEAVAIKMKSLYEWILKKSNKPEFVYL